MIDQKSEDTMGVGNAVRSSSTSLAIRNVLRVWDTNVPKAMLHHLFMQGRLQERDKFF